MDTLKEFQKMMAEQTDLALATVGTDGIPNIVVQLSRQKSKLFIMN